MSEFPSGGAVVVTGASSGIGRETAIQLGAAGAKVVLAARNEMGLQEAVREVEQAGGEATYVVTDVSDWNQVQHLASEAVRRFGSIDAWVNNAGISLYAALPDTEPDEMRRIVEVNLLGEMYGTKAAFEEMRKQGRGVIVNVSSALARRSVPLQAAYCASKHGITGFTEAVRLELQDGYPGIKIVEVLPSSINTPLFDHARSKMEMKPMPIPPVYDPAVVAQAIVHACTHPQREVFAGGSGKLFEVAERISPSAVDWYLRQGRRGVRQQQSDKADDHRDNLFEPVSEPGSTTGDWGEKAKHASAYTQLLDQHPARKLGLGLAAMASLLLLVRRGGG